MNNTTIKTKEKVYKYNKICVICNEEFQTNYKKKKACSKECKRIMDNRRSKKWREENREQYLQSLRRWNEENREYKTMKDKEYRQKNREELLKKKRIHYQENKEYYRKYRIENREHRSSYMKKYRAENRILFQEKEARRVARKRNAFVEDVCRETILKKQENKCNLCGIEFDINKPKSHEHYPNLDHIVPLSKGGFHGMENAQYLCRGCNLSKSDSISDEWGNKQLYEKFKLEGKIFEVVDKIGFKSGVN